ncbi:unnamed protein product [Dovyalis caffra]|uniref:Uncharacterized protein n=1 Tax=Dovyalis caffra TaxID=77055 RepID=A0AAV1SP04_9ROSI|nr:unnamed protein product [Dovyalis caffra]
MRAKLAQHNKPNKDGPSGVHGFRSHRYTKRTGSINLANYSKLKLEDKHRVGVERDMESPKEIRKLASWIVACTRKIMKQDPN